MTANFALNESFLGTAQLRSSIVSLAEGIGYIPDSKTSAKCVVKLSVSLAGVSGRPSIIQLPSGTKFTSVVDDTTFTFQTQENLTAEENESGNGFYEFKTGTVLLISLTEGQARTKTFLITQQSENAVYIIPDVNMDTSTAVVRVYDTPSSTSFSTFTNIINATTINALSTLYILKNTKR